MGTDGNRERIPLLPGLCEKASLVLSCHCEKRSDDLSAKALAKAEAIHLKFELDCRSRQASFAMTSQVCRFSHSLSRSGPHCFCVRVNSPRQSHVSTAPVGWSLDVWRLATKLNGERRFIVRAPPRSYVFPPAFLRLLHILVARTALCPKPNDVHRRFGCGDASTSGNSGRGAESVSNQPGGAGPAQQVGQ